MPDSDGVGRAGKRERLVASASDLLHRHGVTRTTLADVATAADVPLGNVYYYFKTKDDLVQAVIEAHAEGIRAALGSLDRHRTPRARLKAFVRMVGQNADLVALHGCPHGSLCSELDKRDDGLDQAVATLMTVYVDWAQEQFRLMGKKNAHDLAVTLVAAYQGASLLTNAFRDPGLMTSQARQLESWIDSVT